MLELRESATALGLSTTIIRATPADLSKMALPVIAHLEDGPERGGHFVVVVGCDDETVRVIDGTTALPNEILIDDFRRGWSGHLLTVQRRPPWASWISSISLGMVALVSFWWWRGRRARVSLKTDFYAVRA